MVTFIESFKIGHSAKLTAKPDFLNRFGSCLVSFALIGQKSGLRPNDQSKQNFDECDPKCFSMIVTFRGMGLLHFD